MSPTHKHKQNTHNFLRTGSIEYKIQPMRDMILSEDMDEEKSDDSRSSNVIRKTDRDSIRRQTKKWTSVLTSPKVNTSFKN